VAAPTQEIMTMKLQKVTNTIIILFAVMYFLSPVDIVPDVVPAAGQLDDILIPLLIALLGGFFNGQEEKAE